MKTFGLWKRVFVIFVVWATAAIVAPGQTFTTIFGFDGSNGYGPNGPLVQGLDGNFYGTTFCGGINKVELCGGAGAGTIFRITPDGTLATLYNFCAQPHCADGIQPNPLMLGTDGNFYGTTGLGGLASGQCPVPNQGCGTLFRFTPSGVLTTLYKFCAQPHCVDGREPSQFATLVQAADGNFYGTTLTGGANCHLLCGGTVFKITPSGAFTSLYSFCSQPNCSDGMNPNGSLIQASDGNLYGTTLNGGKTQLAGTVFKITTAGKLTTLHLFDQHTNPAVPLVQGTDGKFYGTTFRGGTAAPPGTCVSATGGGCGTAFKMKPSGTITAYYSFCSQANCADGAGPGTLVQATDGNFYGSTAVTGLPLILGGGTLFKITPSLALTTLYVFGGNLNDPAGTSGCCLLQATDGDFYGETRDGGSASCPRQPFPDCGTIFKLSVGLGPFVQTVPTSGMVGGAVTILGTNLKGATGVSFNGTAAAFTVVSSTQIDATVPAGATTGTVTVTKPSGTLDSSAAFRVRP